MGRKIVAVVLALSLIFMAAILGQSTILASADSASSSTAPPIQWQQKYSIGTGAETESMIQTSDGGYALAGQAMYLYLGAIGPWLIKVDSAGNQQWSQPYLSEEINLGFFGADALVQTADGGYAFVGSLGNSSTYLIKTDFQGNIQWRQNYTVGADVSSLIKSNDGGYVMAGSRSDGSFWLAKVDSTGMLKWNHAYGGKASSECMAMAQTSDGGYALAGFVMSSSGSNALLVKTDSSGNLLWNQTYGGGSQVGFQAFSLAATSDGGCALGGMAVGSNSSVVLLIKTDLYGNVLWNQTYSGLGSPAALSVIQTSDGGYALGCGWYGPNLGNLVKVDSDGNLQWNIALNETVCSVVQTRDGGFTVAGSNFISDNWLASTSNLPPIPSSTSSPTPVATPTPTPGTTPTPIQTRVSTQSSSPSPTLPPSSSTSTILSPSPSPTVQSPEPFQSAWILVAVVIVVVVGVELAVYVRKRSGRRLS